MNGCAQHTIGRRAINRRIVIALEAILFFVLFNTSAVAQIQIFENTEPQDERQPRLELNDPLASFDVQPVDVSAALRQLAEQLNDESYEVREQASRAIETGGFELPEVCSLLLDDTLTLEQRHRILKAAREVLLRTPRGALGIQMQPSQVANAEGVAIEIEVVRLLPGLPAERVLQVGDRITHIDHLPLRGQNDLIRYAQIRRPGAPINLTIRRVKRADNGDSIRDENGQLQYEQLDLTIELGSAELLREANGEVQRSGPVVQQREVQAIQLARSYGTKPQVLELEPDAVSNRKPKMAVAIRNTDDWVEEHHYIKELRRDIKLVQSGAMNRNQQDQRRALWNQRMIELQEMIEDPRTSSDDREFLQQVMRRYIEIISEVR